MRRAYDILRDIADEVRGDREPEEFYKNTVEPMYSFLVGMRAAGFLRECPNIWHFAHLERDHRHECRHEIGHGGRCTCAYEGCRSWSVRVS